jgi:hypothetical protein
VYAGSLLYQSTKVGSWRLEVGSWKLENLKIGQFEDEKMPVNCSSPEARQALSLLIVIC